jgi:NTE family protein
MLEGLDYGRFRDPPLLGRLGPIGAATVVALRKGWCRGQYLRSWLSEALGEFHIDTFRDLRLRDADADPALAGDRAYRFVAMASDVSHGELVRLPWAYRDRFGLEPGDVRVVEAVAASAAIPFYFRPARCPNVIDGRESWLVDGGMLSNFPIDVFDRTDGAEPRWPTFGIKLSARPDATKVNQVDGIISLSRAMLSTMTGFYDRIHIRREDVIARTIFVDTGGVRATDFDVSAEAAEQMYRAGRDAAEAFLDGDSDRDPWDFDAYKKRFRPEVTPLGQR